MKQTINFHDFVTAFHNLDRGEQFSYDALEMIFEFFEENQPDYELDVIGICCEFSELDAEEMLEQCPDIDVPEDADEEEIEEAIIDYLENETTYIGQTCSGFVFINF